MSNTENATEQYTKIDFISENVDQGRLIRAIAEYGQSGQTRLETARILAARALVHFHKHGDATPLSVMQGSIPSHERANAFALWVRKHAPVKWDSGNKEKNIQARYVKDKKSLVPMFMDNEDAARPVIEFAITNPFDVFSKESAIPNFGKSLPTTLRRLLDDSKKAVAGEGKYAAAGKKALTPNETRALNLIRDAVIVLSVPETQVQETTEDVTETLKDVAEAA